MFNLEKNDKDYYTLYVSIGNITDENFENKKFGLLIIEKDSEGFFISEMNENMYHSYGSEPVSIDKSNFFIVHSMSMSYFPFKYFRVVDSRIEEVPYNLVKASVEL